jgi:hypothetical protein
VPRNLPTLHFGSRGPAPEQAPAVHLPSRHAPSGVNSSFKRNEQQKRMVAERQAEDDQAPNLPATSEPGHARPIEVRGQPPGRNPKAATADDRATASQRPVSATMQRPELPDPSNVRDETADTQQASSPAFAKALREDGLEHSPNPGQRIGAVPKENASSAANRRDRPRRLSSAAEAPDEPYGRLTRNQRSVGRRPVGSVMRSEDSLWKQQEHKHSIDRQRPDSLGQQSSMIRRPVSTSIAKCIALYHAMLQNLTSGLRKAEKLLEADVAAGHPDTVAQGRFVRVARKIALDDPNHPILVDKWLDMSTNCGFATKMSDGRTGCCFNDSSIMFHWSTNRDVPDVTYTSAAERGGSRDMTPRARSMSNQGSPVLEAPQARHGHRDGRYDSARYDYIGSAEASRATFRSSRTFRNEIGEKARMLSKMRGILEEDDEAGEYDGPGAYPDIPPSCSISFLGEDGQIEDPSCTESLLKVRGASPSNLVHVREWQRYKNPRAVSFRLSNDCIQIKIYVASTRRVGKAEEDFLLDARRQMIYYRGMDSNAWECRLGDVAEFCFSRRFHQRLSFCARVLARFIAQ